MELTGSTKAAQLLTVGSTGDLYFYTSATPGTLGTLAVQLAGANATFAGAVTVGGNITLPAASAATTRYIISASNNDGTVVFQNGVGSAVAGGSLQLSGLTHATRPGWVTVGLGSGSTRKFTVSDIGVPGGTDVFTVDQLGKTTIASTTAGSAGAGALVVSGGLATGAASYFGGAVTLAASGQSFFIDTGVASTAAVYTAIRNAGGISYYGLDNVSGTTFSSGVAYATVLQAPFAFVFQVAGVNKATISSTGAATFTGTVSPQQAASAPTYVKGAIYFDTTLNKLRVGGATGWETITSV